MMAKSCTITLKYIAIPKTWQVVTLSNFDLLNPGDLINQDYKNALVKNPNYDVAIVDSNILQALINSFVHLPIPLAGRLKSNKPIQEPPLRLTLQAQQADKAAAANQGGQQP